MIGSRIEVQGLRRDGSEVPLEMSISPLTIGDGWRFYCFLHDVSERQAADEALREAEERFRRAFDDNQVGMALVSPDGRFQRVNHALTEITGYPADELVGKRFSDITHPDDVEADLDALREILDGERYGYRTEKRYMHAKGYPVWISLNVSPVHDGEGNLSHLISQMEDISERKETEERLTRQALHDSLTGPAEPDALRRPGEDGLGPARRGPRSRSSTWTWTGSSSSTTPSGHAAGDQVLVEVGRRLDRAAARR